MNDQSLLKTSYASLFELTGHRITLKAAAAAGLSPVYRLFNKGGFHIYTAEINDRNTSLADLNIKDEGNEGYTIKINKGSTCPTSTSVTYPVNRLFHASQYKYRLVSDTALKAQLVAKGYLDQGVLFRATRGGRYATISRTKCDYSDNAQWVTANFYATKTPANGVAASVGINGETRPADIKLTLGRWYINTQNVVGACPANVACDAVMQWSSGN